MFPPFTSILLSTLRFLQFLGYMSNALKVKYERYSPSNRVGCFYNKKGLKMLGHFGFSYTGVILLLMLFVPNAIWARNKPEGYTSEKENRLLLAFERIGEVLTTTCALIFDDFNPHGWTSWTWWLVAAMGLMALYIFWWARYFAGGQTLAGFYRSLLGIPVPGATLPVAAFLLLGIYGRVIWMLISAVILGIGHIGIHLQHRRELNYG